MSMINRESTLAGGHHPSREMLDAEMRSVKDGVLRMGSLVEQQILAALQALVDHDAEAALAVMTRDRGVNEVQREVSSLIVTTIATQSPVARDLRFLLALDHVTYELERMGDHATSVAKQARKLAPQPPLAGYLGLPAMARAVADLVRGVLLALIDIDEAKARQVAAGDDAVDELYHKTFADVLELHAGRSRQRRSRDAHPVRGQEPGAHRRSGDEHRRGRRLPGHRRDRGPQRVTGATVQLSLLRHAHAGDPAKWKGPDADRPLSPKGRRQADQLARFLAEHDLRPDLLVSSSKVRAVQTAEAVARVFDMPIHNDGRLADPLDLATVDAILDMR